MMIEPLWKPSKEKIRAANLTRFTEYLRLEGVGLEDYWDLHRWSVEHSDSFWEAYLRYSGIEVQGGYAQVRQGNLPRISWFEGLQLNVAKEMLFPKGAQDDDIAIISLNERGRQQQLSYQDLRLLVSRCANGLQAHGVGKGDRVAAYICNGSEAIVAFLACAAIGAVFSSGSPDFGFETAYTRFHQIEPKLLLASASYYYNGKRFDTMDVARQLKANIPSIEKTVVIPYDGGGLELNTDETAWDDFLASTHSSDIPFAPLDFNHPLYILYSSGTTGLPKAMVHRSGGAFLKHHVEQHLHSDIKAGDKVFYFTTCGWMMWNWLVSALAQAATVVVFEGSPSYPSIDTMWHLVDDLGINFFGTSARFIHASKAENCSYQDRSFSQLKTIASTGSPLSPSGFDWIYSHVKQDVHLASIAGGTDIVGCFMLGVPTEPVYRGQIQGPALGADIAAFNAHGKPCTSEAAELVCRNALPSMPLYFWNDHDDKRYRAAYFQHFPNTWRHGDLIEITPQRGIIVYGRSDATLNPGGVRIGTAEIYRPLEDLDSILEALAVGKRDQGDEVIWLFIVLKTGTLDEALKTTIKSHIRSKASPRHVPQAIFAVSQLPRTRSGKTTEIAVSRLVNGKDIPNREVMANPEALDEIAQVISHTNTQT